MLTYVECETTWEEKLIREGMEIMELMPAWKRWGYEEGIEEGIEKGIEKGRQEMQNEREKIVRKLFNKGFTPEEVAETLELPIAEIKKLGQ